MAVNGFGLKLDPEFEILDHSQVGDPTISRRRVRDYLRLEDRPFWMNSNPGPC